MTLDDHQLVTQVREEIRHAKANGQVFCTLPIAIMEALLEKAERPHD